MTKELLEQYRWLAMEIANEQARLEALEQGDREGLVHDILADPETDPENARAIRESRESIRQITVAGIHQAEAQCAEIEAWITGISDRRIQRYVILRYVDGLNWKEIAAKVGGTPDAVKKALYRFLQAQEASEARP